MKNKILEKFSHSFYFNQQQQQQQQLWKHETIFFLFRFIINFFFEDKNGKRKIMQISKQKLF